MNILINDKDNILARLQEEGFSTEAINTSVEVTKQLYTQQVNTIFSEIANKDLPNTIELRLVNDKHRGNILTISAYAPVESNTDKLVFLINKVFLEQCLKSPDSKYPAVVITHELLHAADHFINAFEAAKAKLMEEGWISLAEFSLFPTIQLMTEIRNEGVAVLGSLFLSQYVQKEAVDDIIKAFRNLFEDAMRNATTWINCQDFTAKEDVNVFDQSNLLYRSTPIILLLILEKMGKIDNGLVQKALRDFNNGMFDMTKEETYRIIQSAMNLSTAQFIQGLLLLGEESSPVKIIFDYFKAVQEGEKDDKMDALFRLLNEPRTTETFFSVIEQIIGTNAFATDIDTPYHTFCNNPPDANDFPGVKEKVDALFSTIKTDEDPMRKQIAQGALAYFFNYDGAIGDEFFIIGMVDNLIVIDYALALL